MTTVRCGPGTVVCVTLGDPTNERKSGRGKEVLEKEQTKKEQNDFPFPVPNSQNSLKADEQVRRTGTRGIIWFFFFRRARAAPEQQKRGESQLESASFVDDNPRRDHKMTQKIIRPALALSFFFFFFQYCTHTSLVAQACMCTWSDTVAARPPARAYVCCPVDGMIGE